MWRLRDVVVSAFVSEKSNKNDKCNGYCEFWLESRTFFRGCWQNPSKIGFLQLNVLNRSRGTHDMCWSFDLKI